jgi:hypothetical protein
MRRVRLLIQVVGAVGVGVLVVVVARRAGLSARRAVGAVVIVPIAVASLLVIPALGDAWADLRDEREENAPLTTAEAQVKPGADLGISVDFLAWVEEQLPAGDTFHLTIGAIPEEVFVAGVGVRQAAILQWSLFQLAPHLAVEQSPKARDIEPGEGSAADWLVFYESDPAAYQGGPLGEVLAYAPSFAIARPSDAG